MCCDHSVKENIVSYFSDFQNYFQINIKADNKRCDVLSLVVHVYSTCSKRYYKPPLRFPSKFSELIEFLYYFYHRRDIQ